MNTPTKQTRPPFRSRPPFKRPDSLTILAERLKKLETENSENRAAIAILRDNAKYLELVVADLRQQLLK